MTTVDFINANLPESVRGRIDVNLLAQRLEQGKTLQGGRIVGSGRSKTHGVQYEDGFKLPVAARDRKDVDRLNKTLRSFEQSFRDYDTQRKAEEAAAKAAEEARIKAEEEARRKAEEEAAAKAKAEEDARIKAEEEARTKAETEAMLKAEAEARVKAAEEARRKAEEEARLNAEAEDKRRAEEEARLKAEAESRAKAEALALAKEMADNAVERTRLAKEEAAAKTVTAMAPTPTYDQTEAAIPTAELPQAPQAQPIPVQDVTPVKEVVQTQSAAPQTATYRFDYTGTGGNIDPTLLNPMGQSPQNFFQQRLEGFSPGAQTVMYKNQFGTTIPVTEVNGQPLTAVPPGYTRAAAKGGLMTYAEGGVVGDFSPEQSASILAKMFGYQGPAKSDSIQQFLAANPAAAARMGKYREAMSKMVGGQTASGFQEGGVVGPEQLQAAQQNLVMQAAQPIQQAVVTPIVPSEGQFIAADAGQTTPIAPAQEAAQIETVAQAAAPTVTPTSTMQVEAVQPTVQEELQKLTPQQGQVTQVISGEQQKESAVSNLQAAQGAAVMMDNPVKREIQDGELISGSAVDATKVAELNAMTKAATASPSKEATVQGQLEGLLQQFEGGKTPAWAAGAMRNAQAILAARGLGSSSIAGQAVIQAAMESAFPIAQADANTRASFEAQNLSNRQQAAMLAAEQRARFLQIEFDQNFQTRVQNASRIADVANLNFTAEQQVALENSRAANTVNLANLSNRQAMIMAEASALANLDMANLNNRQQAAVQNAQNFLQMDLSNLNNRQQTEVFKTQQNIQAMFTDQAAENAAAQFNATSENQTKQFFASLANQTAQFNAAQTNAINQTNVGQTNAMREFNATIQQQRDLFNAQNGLVIAQANAQWRQNLDTVNTAAQNAANMEFARTLNAMSAGTLDQIWQRERDMMSFAFSASESAQDRALSVLLADKNLEAFREKMQNDESTAKAAAWTKLLLDAIDFS